MPLFDYKCPRCGATREALVRNAEQMVTCNVCVFETIGDESRSEFGVVMDRLPSAPSFVINGFSAKNNYAGGQTYEVKSPEKNMRVIVKS